MTSQRKSSLRFVTWNTGGIKNTHHSPDKSSDLLKIFSDLQADIVFLQETHVGPKGYKLLEDMTKNDWKAFFTVHNPRSKGVAILIRDKVPFEYICHDEDCSGGYIVLFCRLFGELYTLVNVYNHKADRDILARLKDYLMETAEGVLVVGGDFNTVLHPSFDRRPSYAWHSQFRAILEDFTASLNLRDTWSYLHSTEKVFTRRQNESYSRLDMFFMQEVNLGQVSDNRVEKQDISDHHPLVLELRVQEQTEKKIPNVATSLKEFTYSSDRRSGKISGAEILSAIKSLTGIPGMENVKYYESNRCPLTETLKIEYNTMIKNKEVPELFKTDSGTFNMKYSIFYKILAKRLSAFFTPSFKGRTEIKLDKRFIVTFKKKSHKIKWSYLKKRLDNLKTKQIPSAPPAEFSILDSLLPEVQNTSGEFRRLSRGFPLTNTILNLALKHLEEMVYAHKLKCEEAAHPGKRHMPKCKEIRSKASVCYQRQVLLIHAQPRVCEIVSSQVKYFEEISGLKMDITKN
ncbi:uncharacterized protein LOC108265673 [Ictalurus punctatus]|uniref:exodeoxyribonuclease III n=1 Tax=Ictalurus punctatus TaxID=7998 RepID=A0A2D0QZB5_ICTPU|nr:uncharacterized protein LOC108265673 [Ictalurus punctatus]